jgi:hypothetical protein
MKEWLEKNRIFLTAAFFLLLAALILNVVLNFGVLSVEILIGGGVLGLIFFLVLTNSFWPNLKWLVGLGIMIALMLMFTTCGVLFIGTVQICP